MRGLAFNASATRSAGTVWPYGAGSSTICTPYARPSSSQRSPNLPAVTTATVSPGDSVFTTAASIAPVPEHASGITSCEVCTSRLSPARTSTNSASYSGVRWWMIGCAMASSTSLGTGVGPGAISWYFFIGSRPPRRRWDRGRS
jgi:hypothetical protein